MRLQLMSVHKPAWLLGLLAAFFLQAPLRADSVIFTTNGPDGKMAAGTRPEAGAQIEIEAADDFILDTEILISSATFTGLVPAGTELNDLAETAQVVVEIYRVFPNDSNTTRTPRVPTRTNSPSDVAFDSRDSSAGTLTFTVSDLGPFAAANSVLNGINPSPNQRTGGEGPVSGEEVLFTVTLATPFDLPADHYFFVPQVHLSTGQFFWLSAPKPIVAPGTPLATDLQAWIRNANLDPDWLRIGTDIVGGNPAPTFNMTFSLTGAEPQPPAPSPPRSICGFGTATMAPLMLTGLLLMRVGARRPRASSVATT